MNPPQPSSSELKACPIPEGRLYDPCPACDMDTLVINKGHLLCTWHKCTNPIAAMQLLQAPYAAHTRTHLPELRVVRDALAKADREYRRRYAVDTDMYKGLKTPYDDALTILNQLLEGGK